MRCSILALILFAGCASSKESLSETEIIKALVLHPQVEALVDSLLSPNVFSAIEDEYKYSSEDKSAEDFFKYVFAELMTRLGKPYYNAYRHPKRVVHEYAQWSLDNGFNIVLELERDTWTRKAVFDLRIIKRKDQPP